MTTKVKGPQKPWDCEHCKKTGKNRANYRRDHGKRCPVYLIKKSGYDRLTGLAVGIVSVAILWGLSEWSM